MEQDIVNCSRAAVPGLGIWEYKLAERADDEVVALLDEQSVRATFCFPNTPGPRAGTSLFAEPKDPALRLQLLRESIQRFARYNPVAVVCLAGPPDPSDPSGSRRQVVDALREAAKVAADAGVQLALEVISPGGGGSLAPTISAAADLIDDTAATNLGILIDAWHSAGVPGTAEDLGKYSDRILGVQLCDRKDGCRGWLDRVFPGEGMLPLTRFIADVARSGFDGWYEIEIFSDDGTFCDSYEDSIWRRPPLDVVREGRAAFDALYAAALNGDPLQQ